ncbi:hypothetical protein [Paenisporosarcina sp. TG-14]|uniref:hypothetical protein n=1 Tax=Paenisporosarcina sp. TG-14 TaxID=1231057 RepID=UPI000303E307|nr:hypothetical protein [Paenisporosarcina sp. TG-14]
MKKWIIPIAILLILCVNLVLSTKVHYPELPFTNKTKLEVANLATTSNLPLSKVTQEDGYVWFVTNDPEDVALQSLKQRMTQNGWEYVEANGSGFFFEKDEEKVMIKSQKWTNNYLLFQLPLGL